MVTIMFLLSPFFIFLEMSDSRNHSNALASIINTGSRVVKIDFIIAFDGANNFISESVTKQSNDRNTSEGAPIIFAGMDILVTKLGNFRLNEIAIVIICR